MGALDDCHYDVELENTVKVGCFKVGLEKEPDTSEIEDAVRVLLHGLGEDINREGIVKTPLRVAKALHFGTRGYKQNEKDIVQGALFPEAGIDNKRVGQAGGVGGLVIVRDLDLFSYCESCLLPFQVKCHVGYVPSGQRVVGLSKLSRVADVFAKRLQDPQRLADEICSALHHAIKPAGVAVVLQCLHIHFPTLDSLFLETSSKGWLKALVSSGCGAFENGSASIWSEFFSLLKLRRPMAVKIQERKGIDEWCPSMASPIKISPSMATINLTMVSAVTLIIRSLGEDPLRKELTGTPARFVRWLMNFQNGDVEMKLNGFASSKLETVKSNSFSKIHSELNLPFWSQCEHHLLPFHGVVHIGYFGSIEGHPIEKSLLQSIVHFYGFKLQVQERLTRQVAETVAPLLGGDIIVVAEASHTCMIARGIEKFGSSTATVAVLGRFATDSGARALFLESLPSTNDFYRFIALKDMEALIQLLFGVNWHTNLYTYGSPREKFKLISPKLSHRIRVPVGSVGLNRLVSHPSIISRNSDWSFVFPGNTAANYLRQLDSGNHGTAAEMADFCYRKLLSPQISSRRWNNQQHCSGAST